MTTIIRAEAAHDFLALVPALTGYAPERSLVCVAFRGNRTVGVLRHDLPRRARDREALVSVVVGTVCRMPGVDAIVPIAYTGATFARRKSMPERPLLRLMVARAAEAGFVVRDALCVAADGWGSLLDSEMPPEGHPLELIAASAVASEPDLRTPDGAGVASLAELPAADPDVAADVAHILHVCDGADRIDAFGLPRPPKDLERLLEKLDALVDPVELVEALVVTEPGRIGAERLAWLVHLAGRPAFRDAMMLQFAFGPFVGEMALDDSIEANERAAASGESMDQLVRRELAEGGPETIDGFLSRLMLGQTTARPDAERIERAIAVLRRAIAHVPERYRPGALCIAGWLAWALGRGSAAGAFLDRALEVEPTHTMAGLLHAYFGSGAIPEWAFAAVGADGAGTTTRPLSDR